ncbi:MAG: helix-turn-helix domain-containing protein [Anaerolineae bacterium]|nr:helix-turn-helix domain-containing protein [Anaerolineae bacterium]
MSLREGFEHLVEQEGANMCALCRSFGISRKTGYKWLKRYRAVRATASGGH